MLIKIKGTEYAHKVWGDTFVDGNGPWYKNHIDEQFEAERTTSRPADNPDGPEIQCYVVCSAAKKFNGGIVVLGDAEEV